MMPGTSQLVAGAPTAWATLASKRGVFIASGLQEDHASEGRFRSWLKNSRVVFGSLRVKGDLRPVNLSKTAVVAENILVPV
jgi:hypothetical protein